MHKQNNRVSDAERIQGTNLSAHSVRRRPQCIVFLGDLTVINDPFQLLHHTLVYISLV